MNRALPSVAPMFENDRDSLETPIKLRFHKSAPEDEIPLELRRDKQRSHDRLSLDVELWFWSESNFYSDLSGNSSQAGLFVATYRPLQPGQSVILRVGLFGVRVELEGLVRWRRAASEHAPPGVGVALRNVPPNARRLIDAFCARRAPIYYELDDNQSHSG